MNSYIPTYQQIFTFPLHCIFRLSRFITGPVVILVANHVMAVWVREKVVNIANLTVTLAGHLVFLVRRALIMSSCCKSPTTWVFSPSEIVNVLIVVSFPLL